MKRQAAGREGLVRVGDEEALRRVLHHDGGPRRDAHVRVRIREHNTLRLAQFQPDNHALNTADHSVDDGTNFVFVLGKHNLTLCFAQTLQYNLLGGLRGHATKGGHLFVQFNKLANGHIFLKLLGIV